MLIIGHRGCSYKGYNQNTIRSYRKIIEEGAKAFEFDVQLTCDNELVVVHNLNLSKVSDGIGLIKEKSLEQIKQLHAGDIKNGCDPIPTLLDVLNLISGYEKEKRPVMHLELKGDNTGFLSGEIIKDYVDRNLLDYDDFLISSFNWDELSSIRKSCPSLKIALLDGSIRRKELISKIESDESIFSDIFAYGEEDYMLPFFPSIEKSIALINDKVKSNNDRIILIEEVKKALNGSYYTNELIQKAIDMNAVSINLWYQTVTKEFIEKAHKKGLKVLVFTVNEKEDIKNVLNLNVDGFFTDYYLQTKEYLQSLV
ncbi:MAG: glycerophosphodiester phosphodiesterase family protein [Sphaerochaetaceae bacterium]|nr:glycerophosphodiester phosphodiesterase family protein [Sphaerochaetaceae bacterium]MDC7237395.1 glycerophosphodiester phosphodiesterase family protein [Sphaerochaetaceae bacterium]MDC7249057.1 glycerophosphodiester phosphodiesterase family protein [Sphaerochaetaceae bacterium]